MSALSDFKAHFGKVFEQPTARRSWRELTPAEWSETECRRLPRRGERSELNFPDWRGWQKGRHSLREWSVRNKSLCKRACGGF
jgi:hypothetical protein